MSGDWDPQWVYHDMLGLLPYCPASSGPANQAHLPAEGQILAPVGSQSRYTFSKVREALLEIQGLCQEVAHEVEDPTQAVSEIETTVRKTLTALAKRKDI